MQYLHRTGGRPRSWKVLGSCRWKDSVDLAGLKDSGSSVESGFGLLVGLCPSCVSFSLVVTYSLGLSCNLRFKRLWG